MTPFGRRERNIERSQRIFSSSVASACAHANAAVSSTHSSRWGETPRDPAHGGDRIDGLVLAHEPNPYPGSSPKRTKPGFDKISPLKPQLAVLTPQPLELFAFDDSR